MWKVTWEIFIGLFLWFLLTNPATNAERILVITPTDFYSHQVVFRSLCLALHKRGHELTVVTPQPIKDSTLKNYTEIDLSDMNFLYKQFANILTLSITELLKHGWKSSLQVSTRIFDDPKFKELYRHNSNEKFDAVILEPLAYFSLSAMAHRFNAPLIGFISLDLHNYHRYIFGSPVLSSHASNWELNTLAEDNLSIWQRLWNFIDTWHFIYYCVNEHIMIEQEIVKKYLGNDVPHIIDIMKNMSVMLVNENPILTFPRPEPPNVVFFNGIHIERTPPSLPKDLRQFLYDAMKGFIYVSFGTLSTCNNLPRKMLKDFVQVFSKLPYKIVWKFECEELLGKLDNIFISKWFLQQGVLAHPNIKLFISQGGMQSTEEALYYAVPILGIPIKSEQEFRIRRLVSLGAAKCIKLNELTEERFDTVLHQMINDKSYKDKMMYLSSLFKDQPYNSTENAIWWIEYVMRHKKANHLRFSESDKPWYQRYDMDIIAFFASILFIVGFIIQLSIIQIIRFILNKTVFSPRH